MSSFLFVYPQLKKLTGAERLIIKLADFVEQLGHRVTLATHYLDGECRETLPKTVKVVGANGQIRLTGNHYLDAALEYALTPRLLGRARSHFDAAVFFGGPGLPALAWAKKVRRVQFPCLYFCYEPPRFAYTDTAEVSARLGALGPVARLALPMYRVLDGLLVHQADSILVNGDFGRWRVQEVYGVDSTVITHGVDLPQPSPERTAEIRKRLGIEEGTPLVMTVNHLHPRKRIDLFIRSIKLVTSKVPGIRGLVVGSGPEMDRLKRLVADLGLDDRVMFTGFVPEGDLASYYALAQVYANPAKVESFGLSVLEALAAGLPVVSVDEGGPAKTVGNGTRGLLVDSTPAGLAGGIVSLLENPEQARAMGVAAREYVDRNFQWSSGARTLIEACGQLPFSACHQEK
ncbi:MAG: glycosyltransferase family 4 protein [Chloroflexi bacterium]|nr:glycosyltransferase family 4 protein [Chloroflexota bacterium]